MSTSPNESRNPTLRFLFAHPAHLLALGFGSGLAPRAPGTFGTLAAWALYYPIRPYFNDWGFLLFLAWGFILGAFAIEITGRRLGEIDHGSIVWDEFIAIWLVLFFTPANWLWQVAAFCLFRLFDITKPPPIRQADARFKNGLGVMFDDILAAAYSLIVLAVAARILLR
ncbi:phosphatidylglycerophosphatase A [Niveibacterium sp. SC-1]|uniref:phosphatidylglycerophosphatase A family protein n=1 Tax=Niveibacterium sp. SC-1 TaxID=3135646 RepID=UPI00311E3273